jgi:RHS repeat-associated protein
MIWRVILFWLIGMSFVRADLPRHPSVAAVAFCNSPYVYDGPLVIQERDTNNNPQVTYTRGLDLSLSLRGAGGIGGLLARTDSNGPACYHSDGNGNITALIDADQYVAARYEYDPYGKLIGKWGRLADANRYRFSSKEYQPASGLYYYGYRFYEPNFGRWLNHDPLGEVGGVNLYGFNGNNPVNFVDPYGLLSWGDFNPGLLLSGQAWGQLAHNVFMGDHPEPALDPNSLQALQNAVGVGVTPLTDENGNQITPNQALGQMAQDALGDAAQLAMMLPLGPEEAAGAAAEDAAKAAKTAKEAKASTPCPATPKWKMPTQKGAPKMQRQMQQRGWTPQDITDAMEKGQKFPAPNNVNPANAATRYVNPTTGQSVVVDDITGEVLHVGGPGFKY